MDTLPSLTRVEAEERSRLLEVKRYDIHVDLMDMLEGTDFRAVSTVRFSCREPGASTFVDAALDVVSATLNGVPIGDDQISAGRIQLDDLADDNVLIVESVQSRDLCWHTGAPVGGPVGQRGLRLDHVRARRSQVRLGLLRPARPQGPARLHGGRTRSLDGREQQRRPGRYAARRRRRGSGSSPTRPPCRRTSRSSTPGRSTRSAPSAAATTWGCCAGGRSRRSSNGTPRSSSKSRPRVWRSTATASACRSPSASTTRSSCPTWAVPWRTTGA